MVFTYDLSTPDNNTRVRYHVGDVDSTVAMFQDDEIAFVLSEEGTWQLAVVSLIKSIIARLSHEPDMTADWLTISWRRSADNWQKLLSVKMSEFGINSRSAATVTHVYRPDSLATEAPDYDS